MRVACFGYRSWAIEIYNNLKKNTDHNFLIEKDKNNSLIEKIIDYNPDIILFYGWSWIVPKDLLLKYKCLMLHPSPLPLFRGGSPIQNQIIRGHLDTKLSIFIMNNEIDAGPIVAQEKMSLDGNISDIFKRMTQIGTKLTIQLLEEGFFPVEQDEKLATYYKRLSPDKSEITLKELEEESSLYLYNKIRMLQDPYPNAFIRTVDKKKLLLKIVAIEDDL